MLKSIIEDVSKRLTVEGKREKKLQFGRKPIHTILRTSAVRSAKRSLKLEKVFTKEHKYEKELRLHLSDLLRKLEQAVQQRDRVLLEKSKKELVKVVTRLAKVLKNEFITLFEIEENIEIQESDLVIKMDKLKKVAHLSDDDLKRIDRMKQEIELFFKRDRYDVKRTQELAKTLEKSFSSEEEDDRAIQFIEMYNSLLHIPVHTEKDLDDFFLSFCLCFSSCL